MRLQDSDMMKTRLKRTSKATKATMTADTNCCAIFLSYEATMLMYTFFALGSRCPLIIPWIGKNDNDLNSGQRDNSMIYITYSC